MKASALLFLVCFALDLQLSCGYSEMLSAAIKVNNWKKHSTDASSSSKSAKNIFTKDVEKRFVAGLASSIDVIGTKDHYSSVTEPHGMIIKKFSDTVQLGTAPWLMKDCADECLLFEKCKFGTFVKSGVRQGECWLSAATAQPEKVCKEPCQSYKKVLDKKATKDCDESGCKYLKWVVTGILIDVNITVPDHVGFSETEEGSASIVGVLREDDFRKLLVAKLANHGITGLTSKDVLVEHPKVVEHHVNDMTDNTYINPAEHGIIDPSKINDDVPEEEIDVATLCMLSIVALAIIFFYQKSRRGQMSCHSLWMKFCGSWSFVQYKKLDRDSHGYDRDAGFGEMDELMHREDDGGLVT